MKKILVVDDSITIRQKLISAIQTLGLMTLEASNGEEAVEIIKTNPPDLVITEIILPQMNGFGLIRRIGTNPTTSYIPIIAYSNIDDEFTRFWTQKGSNVQAFITKTEPLENLLQAIQTLIN